MDQLGLLRHDMVFRRGGYRRGSKTSDTSSAGSGSLYSSFYSVYSSSSDVSAQSSGTEFDVSGMTVIAADSDVEDGFLDSSSLNPVSVARLYTCTLTPRLHV